MATREERMLASPAATRRLGAEIALWLAPGDLVSLTGPVGVGKTALARAIIESLADAATEVPSPTFMLVQTYPELRVPVSHFDLYRVENADEMEELGLDEALSTGVAIVEWAERMGGRLPADHLEIVLADTGGETRRALLHGHGVWAARLARGSALARFLAESGLGEADRRWLKGDASTRAYERIAHEGRSHILMNAPKGPDGPPVRDGLPYSQIAHLAEDVRAFVAVDLYLRNLGLSAPEIVEADLERGFLLTEDLSDRLYGDLVQSGVPLDAPYDAAMAALAVLHDQAPPAQLPFPGGAHAVPRYDFGAVLIEAELLLDWYWPSVAGMPCPEAARDEYRSAWRALFATLEGPEVLVLRDFHSPNLLWLPDRGGAAAAGLIDFQDALVGHPSYDLVSLAQDARLDLPAGMEERLVAKYLARRPERMRTIGEDQFRAAYAVLGAQRAAKVVGIFTRLFRRDGKSGYLAHIPRVLGYLRANLRHPHLTMLSRWFARYLDLDADPKVTT